MARDAGGRKRFAVDQSETAGRDGDSGVATDASEDDAYYAQFKVPDDLVW